MGTVLFQVMSTAPTENTACQKPCAKCPFRKDIEPGYLGGSTTSVFIGQIRANMTLPCHMAHGYRGNATSGTAPQCVGAAIFRANNSVPETPWSRHNLHLPADTIAVFASYEEFLAHHDRLLLVQAQYKLRCTPPIILASIELRKARVEPAPTAG